MSPRSKDVVINVLCSVKGSPIFLQPQRDGVETTASGEDQISRAYKRVRVLEKKLDPIQLFGYIILDPHAIKT